MRRFLVAAAALLLCAPAQSQVDLRVHKLCVEAKDYSGCVKSMTGTDSKMDDPASTIRIIEGERELTGNSCPEGFAYSGSGWCSDIECISRSSGHSPGLGGKRWACPKLFGMGYAMTWGKTKLKATYDPSCPKNPPEIGWKSSCEQRDYGR